VLQRFGEVRVIQVEIGTWSKDFYDRLSRSRMTSTMHLLVPAATQYAMAQPVTGLLSLCPSSLIIMEQTPDSISFCPSIHRCVIFSSIFKFIYLYFFPLKLFESKLWVS